MIFNYGVLSEGLQVAKTLTGLHICTVSSKPSLHALPWDKYQKSQSSAGFMCIRCNGGIR